MRAQRLLVYSIAVLLHTGGTVSIAADSVDVLRCGPGAFAMSLANQGVDIPDSVLISAFQETADGACTFGQIEEIANELGYFTKIAKMDPHEPLLTDVPMIVSLSSGSATTDNHFVVTYGRFGNRLQVCDYPNPPRFRSIEDLAKNWNGVGLYVAVNKADLASVGDARVQFRFLLLLGIACAIGGALMFAWRR